MKKEAVSFFEENLLPVSRLIHIGVTRRQLTAAAIKKAAEELYKDIEEEKVSIPRIRMAWEIFNKAREMKITEEKNEHEAIKLLKKKVEWYEQPWWKKALDMVNGGVKRKKVLGTYLL